MAIGGTEQVIRQLVENTDAEKYSVSVLCLESDIGDIGQQLLKQGIDVTALSRQAGFDFSLLRAVRAYLYSKQIDIIHCHQYTPYVYGVLAAFLTRVKVIFTEHGRFYPDFSSRKRKLINPLLALLTGKITSISEATKQALIEFEAFPAEKIQVIYNGIADLSLKQYDTKALKRDLNLVDNEMILGTIARLDPIKNHKMMLRAFKEINCQLPNTKMLIIGDGPLRQETQQLCIELDIREHVIFTGFIVEPQQYLKIMDVFLLPSFSEGTSMTLLEAMSFSKPCVVTDVGGNPEIVKHGQTGIVIANNDQAALQQACVSLLKNIDLQLQYGQAGRQRFLDDFSVENMTVQFEKIYQEL